LFNLDLKKIGQFISNNNFSKILIQVPEGLLGKPLKRIITILRNENIDYIVSGSPIFGMCDLDLNEAKNLNCDAIIHLGHTDFFFKHLLPTENDTIQVLVIPVTIDFNINEIVQITLTRLKELNWNKLGIVTTAQYIDQVNELIAELRANDYQIFKKGTGQILGCNVNNGNYHSEEIDGILSITSGNFHSSGLLYQLNHDILVIDPINNHQEVLNLNLREKWIKKRFMITEKAKRGQIFGILASSKPGQWNPKEIENVKGILSSNNKQGIVITTNTINPEFLLNFTWIDGWINTACPRIAFEDTERYIKPLISLKEFYYLFNKLSWDQLINDGFL